MDVIIRQAVLNDYNEVAKLEKQVHKLHCINRPDMYIEAENPLNKERYMELLKDKKQCVFVAEASQKEIVAMSIIKFMHTKNLEMIKPRYYCYIEDFCVKDNQHRKGIGRKLLKYVADYAKEKGAPNLELTVWEFNSSAIKFYESLGFKTRVRRMEMGEL